MSEASARPQAVFLEGPLMRHVAVMTATGSVGLMAVFVVAQSLMLSKYVEEKK